MEFCYVILHYRNIQDTVKCVESLKESVSSNSKLIIVDNGSNDGSIDELKNRYLDDYQCDILLLQENIGFSKGNNLGYIWAKENYNPKFIIITNNDVIFYQRNFEELILKLYQETNFYVLGPDIYVPRHNDHQNPLFKRGISFPELEKELEEYRFYQKNPKKFNSRLHVHALKNRLCSNSKLIRKIYNILRNKDDLDYKKRYENVGLQGACLIFSKLFLNKEDKAFSPEPFLYEEEVFLFYRCMKNNYKMVYSPEIAIRHEEAASFIYSKKDNCKRLEFMLHHHVIAREMLLEYLKNEA